ncbi:MAG: PEP-CTERM sorting domain-containing protein [Deltaproteobacteria bacterium]|nr:PEP-CTERM sorting domain-containing protein [Deltaproteobacteria bacterium]
MKKSIVILFSILLVLGVSRAYAVQINFLCDPHVESIIASPGVEFSASGTSFTIFATGNDEKVLIWFNFETTPEPESVEATWDWEFLVDPTKFGDGDTWESFAQGFTWDDNVITKEDHDHGTSTSGVYGFYHSALGWWTESNYITNEPFLIVSNLYVTGPFVQPIPEPTTMLLLSSGLVGLAGFRRKFRKL